MPFRGTHIKVWWASTCVSPNIRPNSILVITSQDNNCSKSKSALFLVLQRWNCVVDWSWRLPTLTICKRSSLWCVNCPICCPGNLQQGVGSLREERPGCSYLRCTTKPVNESTITSSKSANGHKKFHFAFVLFNINSKLVGADPNLWG